MPAGQLTQVADLSGVALPPPARTLPRKSSSTGQLNDSPSQSSAPAGEPLLSIARNAGHCIATCVQVCWPILGLNYDALGGNVPWWQVLLPTCFNICTASSSASLCCVECRPPATRLPPCVSAQQAAAGCCWPACDQPACEQGRRPQQLCPQVSQWQCPAGVPSGVAGEQPLLMLLTTPYCFCSPISTKRDVGCKPKRLPYAMPLLIFWSTKAGCLCRYVCCP